MGVIQECRNVVMKAKAQLELELAREVKGSRKGFCKDTGSKRKAKKSMHTLVNGDGDLVKSNREKAEVRNAFFFCLKFALVGSALRCLRSYQNPWALSSTHSRGRRS